MSEARIPIPWNQRWKRIRYQSLPVAMFVVSVMATVWLWSRFVGQPNVVGEVFAMRADAISRGEGILVEMPGSQLEVMQQVRKGDIIARIDPSLLLTQLSGVTAELAAVEAKLEETTEETRFAQLDREVRHEYEARALATFIEQSRVAALTMKAAIATDTIELQGLDQVLKLTSDGVEKKALTRMALVAAQKERNIVAQRIESANQTLKQTTGQLQRALERRKEHVVLPKPDLDKLLAPIKAEITAKQAMLDQIELQIKALDVKAPLDGTIVAVLRRPGQAVKIGDPIMTIAGNEGKFIVSYVRQSRNIRPEANMSVYIRPRRIPRQAIVSEIEEIGSQYEAVPAHQLRAQTIAEWGVPVRIRIPEGLELNPGELVDVRLNPYADSKPAKSGKSGTVTAKRGTT